MGTAMPAALREAIAGLAQKVRPPALAERADLLSRTYRAGGDSVAVRDAGDAAAYATARLPATFAAVARALGELSRLRPDFAPCSMLDAGSGPGSAAFAALERYPGIGDVALLDRNEALLDAARALFRTSGASEGRFTRFLPGDLASPPALEPAPDLVTLAYALVEAPAARAGAIALGLFALARHALVLVEPGSTEGFGRIRAARAALIEAGATILAPCTHALACPIVAPDWCHFTVRLARSREHLRAKSASAPFEDEKFSYLVAVRAGPPPEDARIIAPPRHSKAGALFRLCGASGLRDASVASRAPQYKRLKKLEWGDVVDARALAGT